MAQIIDLYQHAPPQIVVGFSFMVVFVVGVAITVCAGIYIEATARSRKAKAFRRRFNRR